MNMSKEKTVMVGTRVSTNIDQLIKRRAEEMGTSPARIIATAIAEYLEVDIASVDRLSKLEQIVADLARRVARLQPEQPITSATQSEILTEQELCDRFKIPRNWRASIHGWSPEHWLSQKTGATHLGNDRYRLNPVVGRV
jgi:hypothetical protein